MGMPSPRGASSINENNNNHSRSVTMLCMLIHSMMW